MEVTMNFFEQELRKLTVNNFTLSDAKFMGKVCYVPITDSTRLKLEFITQGTSQKYQAIRATMLDKKEGVIDTLTLTFADIWGTKQVSNPNFNDGIIPYAWTYNGKSEWYVYKPTINDYEELAQQLESYAELFMEQEQNQHMNMNQQM